MLTCYEPITNKTTKCLGYNPPGTIARFQCKNFYYQDYNYENKENVICHRDGYWSEDVLNQRCHLGKILIV